MPWELVTGAPVTTSALKVVPLALGAGRSTLRVPTTRSVRIPINFTAEIGRFRIHIRNWNPRLGTVTAAPVEFTGLWLADTSGAGTITGTPDVLHQAFTSPADGSEWVSPWLDAPMDRERLLCFGYSTSTPPAGLAAGSYHSTDPTQAVTGAAHSRSQWIPFDMWIEAETPATTPVIAGVGDSLVAGVGASLPVHDSWVSQYARRVGCLPMHVAHSGDSMRGFLTMNPGKVTRWEHLAKADAVVWALGSNDLGGDRSLATMQTDFEALLPVVEAAIGSVEYVSTVLPRNAWGARKESERAAWNTWVTSRPWVRGVLDFASAVSADGDTINTSFDSGDGTHLNTAGYLAESDSITVPLVPA